MSVAVDAVGHVAMGPFRRTASADFLVFPSTGDAGTRPGGTEGDEKRRA